MSEMVELVAYSLALAYGGRISGPGQSIASREVGWHGGTHLERYAAKHQAEWKHAAQFAIEAMRKPMPVMCVAGSCDADITESEAGVAWEAMIDEALK